MAKTAMLRTRVDSDKKEAAEVVLSKLGISLGEAISMFLSQVGIQKGIPFPLTTRPHLDLTNATIEDIEKRYAQRIPNATTQAALAEIPARRPCYKSARQLIKALES